MNSTPTTDNKTTTLSQQLEASNNSAVLFPLAGYHHLAITGPDAERYLQGRVTQDLRSLQIGAAATQAMVLSPQGKILGNFLIYKVEDGYRIIAERKCRSCRLGRPLAVDISTTSCPA